MGTKLERDVLHDETVVIQPPQPAEVRVPVGIGKRPEPAAPADDLDTRAEAHGIDYPPRTTPNAKGEMSDWDRELGSTRIMIKARGDLPAPMANNMMNR